MPQLRELVLTTELDRWRWPFLTGTYSTPWLERHRAMLFAPAWILSYHPRLKFAVWDEEKTVVDGELQDEIIVNDFDNRPTVRLTVTMSASKPSGLKLMATPEEIREYNENKRPIEGWAEVHPVKVIASLHFPIMALTEIDRACSWIHGRSVELVGSGC